MSGNIPSMATDLLKQLPGVGRYTAGAIASIAFGECTGVVDGNVIRVLSRLCSIGALSSSNQAVEKFWELANKLVPEDRPGDFNQALMEFGATLCTPQSPQCHACPLQKHCSALKQVEEHKVSASMLLSGKGIKSADSGVRDDTVTDIEECKLCLPSTLWNASLGVCNYPHKAKKKQPKEETLAVVVLERVSELGSHFLIVQRPKTGLLAGLWEFPNTTVESSLPGTGMFTALGNFLESELGITLEKKKNVESIGEVCHHFSHIHHKYVVYAYKYTGHETLDETTQENREMKWIPRDDVDKAALSTAMRKVFTAFENYSHGKNEKQPAKVDRKRKRADPHDGRKQMVLDAFFKPKN